MRDYGLVQQDAAIESLRRFLVTLWGFVPLELALAWWFGRYEVDPLHPETQVWAHSLFLVHAWTAALTLILASMVFTMLRNGPMATGLAVALQVCLCIVYLMHGAAISFIDLGIGAGISSFTLICVGVGGLSLMRPAISTPLYAGAFLVFWQILSNANLGASMLTSLRINSLAAVGLGLAVSVIVWHQYAKGILLRRQLRSSNDELRVTQRDLETLAAQDPLTGLPNRRMLLDRLRQALASSSRSARAGALIFMDLDKFKVLNDTRGHDVGDLLLQQVGKRLSSCIREGDTVARLGGDEFVILLNELSDHLSEAALQAEAVGEKILNAINLPYQLADLQHQITPSIGITLFVGHKQTADELMKHADIAMYQAKAAGRNTIRFFDPDMQAAVTARVTLEGDLNQALSSGQFLLHYQPQLDSAGRVVGAEALVRWNHPLRGLVPPAEFIPLAEDVGLIVPLGLWVLETACAQLATWALSSESADLTLAVNVSAGQVALPDYVEQVLAILDRTEARPDRLKLELTEGSMFKNAEDVIAKMTALQSMSVRFSLDDFGTGFSSLSYLKRLPLDQLKIDQSFVRDVMHDSNDAVIAKTIIALAQSLDLSVIAEGVETEAQRDFLEKSGCHSFQGYLFSRPLPIADFDLFAKTRR